MIKLFAIISIILIPVAGWAQTPVAFVASNEKPLPLLSGQLPADVHSVVGVGKLFLGKPYVHHTLDSSATEQLVVNFQQFDCTTFLETTLALTLAVNARSPSANPTPAGVESLFRSYLTKLRYRNGQMAGYASRLHYLSDWLYDNERQGMVHDVTGEIGGIQVSKPVSYMTTSPYKYPLLRDPVVYRQVALTEAAISRQPFYFIPKKNIRAIEAGIKEGDIVMLTAARPGLDMKHVGFATWQNGRVYLLHASSDQGEVMISHFPLAEYVNANRGMSGIRVARLLPKVL